MENDFKEDPSDKKIEEKMKSLFHDIELPPGLEDKVVLSLKQKGMIKESVFSMRTWIKVAAGIALAITLFSTGFYLGSSELAVTSPENSSLQSYLLLLYDPKDFVEDENHVKEYGSWMNSIGQISTLASGEALKNHGYTISKLNNVLTMKDEPVTGTYGAVSGFFMIKAHSPEQALEIAASCPHLKYNGVVELRPVLDTSN